MSLLDLTDRRECARTAPTRRVGISGIGAAIPAGAVANAAIAERIGVDPEWILRRTGIERRHRLADGETLTALAIAAAEFALAEAGVGAGDLDAVLVATSSADQIMPHLAPVLAHAIGADAAMAYDIGIACTGFLAGLEQGAALIESRRADAVLLVAADALSRMTDPDDRGTAALFGDGAGAVVLVAGGEWRIGPSVIRADATDAFALSIDHAARRIHMEGQLVFRRAVAGMEAACRELLARTGLGVEDIDLWVPHQANARITAALAERLGIDPARVASNIARVGNTGAASIPLLLAEADVPASGRLLCTAFGAGFAYGATVLELDPARGA